MDLIKKSTSSTVLVGVYSRQSHHTNCTVLYERTSLFYLPTVAGVDWGKHIIKKPERRRRREREREIEG
jgi:hypothetical protein